MQRFRIIVWCLLCVALSSSAPGIVIYDYVGTWPKSWPRELEPLRPQATSIDVGTAIQEAHYLISFRNREQFESAWPFLIKVKSAEGLLILERVPFKDMRIVLNSGVCILAPSNGSLQWPDGRSIELNSELPAIIRATLQMLPEYVAPTKSGDWAEWRRDRGGQDVHGFIQRVRTDIVLVVDGKIVDLNRIQLPKDVTDRRFDSN